MKTNKLFGMMSLIAGIILAFSFTACDNGGDDNGGNGNGNDNGNGNAGTFLNGTWSRTSGSYTYRIVLDNNNWTYYDGNDPISKGTWTSSVTPTANANGNLSLTITQVHTGANWINLPAEYNSLKTCTAKYSINSNGNQLTLSEKQLAAADPTGMWSKLEGTYTKDGGGNAGTYIITGSSMTLFTATKNNATVGTAYQTIANLLDEIRTDANGANCTIQFGNGINVLDIGTYTFSFGDSETTWGNITLSGKLKTDSSYYAVHIYKVTIISTAEIENTGSGSTISNTGSGSTLTINGGTVTGSSTGTSDATVYNESGTVTINGGTVQNTASGGYAIRNYSGGTVTIGAGATVTGNKYGL
jgi:hypothetical protein